MSVLKYQHSLHFIFFLTFFLLPLCLKGVVEGDLAAVEAYKSSGGDIARQLTSDEVRLLNRPSAFDDGFTLVHLAIRFQRQDMLAVLLTEVSADNQQSLLSHDEISSLNSVHTATTHTRCDQFNHLLYMFGNRSPSRCTFLHH